MKIYSNLKVNDLIKYCENLAKNNADLIDLQETIDEYNEYPSDWNMSRILKELVYLLEQ